MSSYIQSHKPFIQMEKEESNSSSPKGICEKLFSAFSAKPSFRSSRSSSYNEDNNHVPSVSASNLSPLLPLQASNDHDSKTLGPQNTLSNPEKPNLGIHFGGTLDKKKEAELVVPIEIVNLLPSPSPLQSKVQAKVSKPLGLTKVAGAVEETSTLILVRRKEKRERKLKKKAGSAPTAEGVVLKEGTGDVKEKVEATLLPPGEVENRKKGESDNINDKASEYIRRAKLKIRTTSSAGVAAVGRAISFK